MTIRRANAPVTWGVWGPHSLPAGRVPADVLHAVADAGYDGIELGALGFFGHDQEVVDALGSAGLASAGAYVPLRFFEGDEALAEDLAALHAVARVLVLTGGTGPLILAEETIPAIKRNVARGTRRPDLDLDDDQWGELVRVVRHAVALTEDAGLMASFHPHTGTHVEQPSEVDRLLESTDVGLTLDTGHALAGGDDPVGLARRWAGRLNHVHIKDIVVAPVHRAGRDGTEFGIADVSVPLGEGDAELVPFLDELGAQGYAGWVVVEQDRRPDGGHDHAAVDREQRRNLAWLDDHIPQPSDHRGHTEENS
jgi:inosose dehydratase